MTLTTTKSIPLAAIQMVSTSDVDANLSTAATLISQACTKNAQFVLLPENFSAMGLSDRQRRDLAETPGEGRVQTFLSKTAAKERVWLAACVWLRDNGRLKNSLLLFDDVGRPAARYDKMHLFEFLDEKVHYDETALFSPGDQPVVADTPFGRVGLSVCYDLRFPELYRAMGRLDLIVVPAAFIQTTGSAHWDALLRARAIENQCYLLAAAQGGRHPDGRETYGHSMLVDPWGAVIDQRARGEGIAAGWLDHGRMRKIRRQFPNHRAALSVTPTARVVRCPLSKSTENEH